MNLTIKIFLLFFIVGAVSQELFAQTQAMESETMLLTAGFGIATVCDYDTSENKFFVFQNKKTNFESFTLHGAVLFNDYEIFKHGLILSSIISKKKNLFDEIINSDDYFQCSSIFYGTYLYLLQDFLYLKGAAGLSIAGEFNNFNLTSFEDSEAGFGWLLGTGIRLFSIDDGLGDILIFYLNSEFCYNRIYDEDIDNISYLSIYMTISF